MIHDLPLKRWSGKCSVFAALLLGILFLELLSLWYKQPYKKLYFSKDSRLFFVAMKQS